MESVRTRPLYGDTGGDPHFIGFDGQRYDVMGEPGKCYCVLSAPRVQVNAHFAAFGGFTVIDQVGVKLPAAGVFFDLMIEHGRQVVWCNHERVTSSRLFPGGGLLVLERRTLIDAGRYLIEAAWCDDHGEPHPKFGKLDVPHLDLYLYPAHGELPGDEPLPHGILGVTTRGPYRPVPGGEQGEGVLDVLEPGSTYRDYEVSSLWAGDFKFNQYRG